ncbi:hypothetical protein MSAN_01645100 [Mycena sanguinolenta]|uniref:Ricin B lectin domain-containing protein n=1 Tax=Mycena sanguinolenta TaxID=230812 RepID=A0A8H7CWJ8_9AGAR|nr:hypothetical protein MSAN_01645100 [Mycena sanguinolenta]
MFSKLPAFGLGALAVVRAAPALSFQTPLLSCSVNLDASVAPVKSFNTIEPGKYMIYNAWIYGANNPLRAYNPEELVFSDFEDPGKFGQWWIAPSENPGADEYTFTNVGLGTHASIEQDFYQGIITTQGQGDSFAIEPADDGTFTIRAPNKDQVWTAVAEGQVLVYLQSQQDGDEQRWRLVPVYD